MEYNVPLQPQLPEYEMKKLLCDMARYLSQRDLAWGDYFSISGRSGSDGMWILHKNEASEFLKPDKLRRVSFRYPKKEEKTWEEMCRYHCDIYRRYPNAGAVITFVPVYMKRVFREHAEFKRSDALTYGTYGEPQSEKVDGYIRIEEHFLTAVAGTPVKAYQKAAKLDMEYKSKLYEAAEQEENMVSQITHKEIEEIVSAVMKNVSLPEVHNPAAEKEKVMKPNSIYGWDNAAVVQPVMPAESTGKRGVFLQMKDAIEAADKAQKSFVKDCNAEDRRRITERIRIYALEHKEELASLNIEETGMGRYEDKIAKIELVAEKTPGPEILTTYAKSGDKGLMIEEMGPYGVIGAVSPVTNPTETLICNAIGMLLAGNAAVYNVHPSGKKVSAYTVDLINRAVTDAGGPENLITMVATPTMDTLKELMEHQAVKILCGTGGPGLVKTLLSSGKKAIGAGAGNPPVIVDETADIELAAKEILKGASFENNILCIAEKEVFVLDSVADDFLYQLVKQGAYMMNRQEAEAVKRFALIEDENKGSCGCSGPVTGKFHINKRWVGKDAALFLEELGVQGNKDTRLLIYETDFGDPFVQLEQMMPVLPIVRVKSLEEAMELAVSAEHGNRHTASMFSRSVNNLTEFARRAETTIFVKNACTMAGVGFGGEGCTTFTIAGPTGEGITSAKTFARVRRCVLAEGGFRIV